MENEVFVEIGHNDSSHERGKKTVCVPDVGLRCADGSGTAGICRICD